MTEKVGLAIDDFTQSQSHGLFWDSEIRQKVFGLPECKNDTYKFDVACEKNKFNPNENISIKTSGNENIDCGDILRFFDRDDDASITIILVRYQQMQTQKRIKEIIEINYCKELKYILFGSITRSELESYVQFIRGIPNGIAVSETKNIYKLQKKNMQATHKMRINISPKVDSKNQRRVQCSIPKIDNLLEEYPQFVMMRTYDHFVRGVKLTSEIDSAKRQRHKKE